MSQIYNLHDNEILRGKHKQSGEWVYGDRATFTMSGNKITNVYLVCGDTYYSILCYTIGNCVGSNKIGDRIFEDDIVKTKDGIGTIEWDDDASQVVIKFEHFTVGFEDYKSLGIEMKIVGNTFDGIMDKRWL